MKQNNKHRRMRIHHNCLIFLLRLHNCKYNERILSVQRCRLLTKKQRLSLLFELIKEIALSLQLLDTPKYIVLLLTVCLYIYSLFPPSFLSSSSNQNSSLIVLSHSLFCECKGTKQNSDLTTRSEPSKMNYHCVFIVLCTRVRKARYTTYLN